MKRRDFLQSAGAAAALPLLPVRAAAGATLAPELVARATSWVGLWDFSAPHLLKYRFDLDDGVAEALFQRLVQDQAISVPNGAGVAKVLSPRMARPFPAKGLDALIKQKFAATTTVAKAVSAQTSETPTEPAPEQLEGSSKMEDTSIDQDLLDESTEDIEHDLPLEEDEGHSEEDEIKNSQDQDDEDEEVIET